MKLILKISISAIIILMLIFACGIFYLSRGLDEVSSIKINEIDLSNVSDGVYSGTYKGGRWSNKLNVTVENHRVTDIDIEDDVTFSKPEVSEELFSRVKEAQNTTVDAVSEATVTSKAYLKSIENALSNK